jgi:hypothetical protein
MSYNSRIPQPVTRTASTPPPPSFFVVTKLFLCVVLFEGGNHTQCKGKNIKLKEEQLDLQCEWQDCDYCTCNLDHFVHHVSLDLPHLEVKVNEDQEGTGSLLFNHMLAHISFCSFLKYFRSV